MDLLARIRRRCLCQYWAYDLDDYYLICRLTGLMSLIVDDVPSTLGIEWVGGRLSWERSRREGISLSLLRAARAAVHQRAKERMVALARLSPTERRTCRSGHSVDVTRLAKSARIGIEQFRCILAEYREFVELWTGVREHMAQTQRPWWWP